MAAVCVTSPASFTATKRQTAAAALPRPLVWQSEQKQQQRWHRHRLQAFSALPFVGGSGEADEAASGVDGGPPPPATHHADGSMGSGLDSEAAQQLRCDLDALKCRMDEVQAQLEQLNDRARERAVSLASAVKAAGGGDAAPLEALQHQQDEQLEADERSWDTMMDTFTQLMSKGYIASSEKIRDRLMLSEWELNRKAVAMRRGVSNFELHCASDHVDLPFEVLSQLYEDPTTLETIQDPHLRMQARAQINQAVDEEYMKCYSHCTAEAQKLAQQFSNTEFISKIIPESGVLDALKKVVPMALKLVV